MAKRNRNQRRAPSADTQARRVLDQAAKLAESSDGHELPGADDASPNGPESPEGPESAEGSGAQSHDGADVQPDGSSDLVAELSERIGQLEELQRRYSKALDAHQKAESALERREDAQAEATEQHRLAVEALAKRESELLERQESLADRELDAQTGFTARLQEMWDRLHEEMDSIRDSLGKAVTEVEKADVLGIEGRVLEFVELRERLESSFARREAELLVVEEELDAKSRELRLAKRTHDAESSDLQDDRADFESTKESILAQERYRLELDRKAWEAEKEQAEAAHAELAGRVAEFQRRELEMRFMDPAAVQATTEDLKRQIRELNDELASRPPRSEYAELQGRVQLADQYASEVESLFAQNADLQSRLEAHRTELERRRLVEDTNQNLVLEKDALVAEVSRMRDTLAGLADQREDVVPFQRCSAMDADSELQAEVTLWQPDGGLGEFVEAVRQAAAAQGLYYTDESIRSFIAGMAVSKLHILQGISGTGKSSLPQVVAKVLCVPCTTVEVQAAWRDRQDLLGYFNPFEHRYQETAFLAALYEAGTPRYRDSPYFVLLDEMNLSHPEQYLADVLSAMERRDTKTLTLMSHEHPLAPERLVDGRDLELPPNVWFVGTANHDETTVSFAPKTYDRAHVMELPTNHPDPFTGAALDGPEPLELEWLEGCFSEARQANKSASSCAMDFLDELRDQLAGMGVGWGNRIEKQLQDYAPVVAAAGGTAREAVDVFVSLKVLKKLEGRYDFDAEQVSRLRDSVGDAWQEVPGGNEYREPRKMIQVLDQELRRVG